MSAEQPLFPAKQPRKFRRPTGAFKLLTFLLYSGLSCIQVGERRECIYIVSFRDLSRAIGASIGSNRVRSWLLWLEECGYIDTVTFSENRRQAKVRLRAPRNVGLSNG